MLAGFALAVLYIALIWVVFFRFRWLRFSVGWGVVSVVFGLHLLIIFLVGMRFAAPDSYRAFVVQPTVQIVPRLPDPTVLTEVLIQDNTPVRKGQPLFRLDSSLYEARVRQIEAQLAEAQQNVLVLQANVTIAARNVDRLKSELDYELFQQNNFDTLAREGAVRQDDIQRWANRVSVARANYEAAQGELDAARLRSESEINGVNTTVAGLEAQLSQARYYVAHTIIHAPADGRIINLQARPGMVVGTVRLGAIAALVEDEGRYLLGIFRQENLKYVASGQSAEIALDLYPGQIFKGTVESIWWGSGQGQMLPTSDLPAFLPQSERMAEGMFAVKIRIDAADQDRFPIGAQGIAAIYTGPSGFAALRRIAIRGYSWLNWVYPL